MEWFAKIFEINPILTSILAILAMAAVVLIIYELIRVLSKKNIKYKDVEINNDDVKKELEQVKQKVDNIDEKIKRTITCISNVANDSINSGYQRCSKRQELYDKQMEFSRSLFDGLCRTISNEYRKNNPYSNIDIILEHIFHRAIYKYLSQIYKLNGLNKRTKEGLIEEKKPVIDSTTDRVICEIGKIFDDDTREQLIAIVKSRNEEFKKDMVISLEKAHDFAKEELNSFLDLSKELDRKIKNNLSYLDNDFDVMELTLSLDDKLPPNNIIGDFK